jgi:hypothetical protein
MNLARTYLETAYADSLFTRDRVEKLEAAGMLRWAKARLVQLESVGESFAEPGASPVDAALALEAQEIAQFTAWREELGAKTNDPGLEKVPLVLVELTTPQAVTIHQVDNSDAIALDRRMTGFLGGVAVWAYIAVGLQQRGVEPLEANLVFIRALADHVLLNYSNLPLSNDFEVRELQMQAQLGTIDRNMMRQVAQLAAKFVLYHELGHVHLKHFASGQAGPVAGDSARISAFESTEMEFQADAFAKQHLTDPNGSVTAAIVATVAPRIYCLLLAMKEAMLPGAGEVAETMARDHPLGSERAARLRGTELPPAYVRGWETLLAMPDLLESIYKSQGFQEAARMFSAQIALTAY